jgi:hypothetical protein
MGWAELSDPNEWQDHYDYLRYQSWQFDLTMWNGLVQTEKRKNKHDDDDKPD